MFHTLIRRRLMMRKGREGSPSARRQHHAAAYPLASASSRYGLAGQYRLGEQTREKEAKPGFCRDLSGRGKHTISWATGANGISLISIFKLVALRNRPGGHASNAPPERPIRV